MASKRQRSEWTDVVSCAFREQRPDDGFARMSYVLFRNDHDAREILASRVPDASFAVGDTLSDGALLDGEAIEYLNRAGGWSEPLMVCTDHGVGLLSKIYDGCAALGLYLHLHLPPEPVSRLINSGVLEGSGADRRPARNERVRSFGCEVQREDEAYYMPLADWWADVQGGRRQLLATSPKKHYRLHTDEMAEAIRRLAAFVGCGVNVTVSPTWGESGGEVTCYNPELVEACLLFLLSEVRERAATRSAAVMLESVSGERGGGLRLTLRYAVVDGGDTPTVTAGFSHMEQVAELCGLDLYSTFGDARPAEPGEREKLRDCTVVLEWLRDPTQLCTSDLKARLRLIYND